MYGRKKTHPSVKIGAFFLVGKFLPGLAGVRLTTDASFLSAFPCAGS